MLKSCDGARARGSLGTSMKSCNGAGARGKLHVVSRADVTHVIPHVLH